MPICLIASDVIFYHLVKMVYARFLHCKGNRLWSLRNYVFTVLFIYIRRDSLILILFNRSCLLLFLFTVMLRFGL